MKGSDLKRSPENANESEKSVESYRTGGTHRNQRKSRTHKYANRAKIARHRRDTTQLEHTRGNSGKREDNKSSTGYAQNRASQDSRHACAANVFQLHRGGADGGARRIAPSLSANRKVCSAHRERKEYIRSALPKPSAENATGSEKKARSGNKKNAFSSGCALVFRLRLFRHPRPPGGTGGAQVRLQLRCAGHDLVACVRFAGGPRSAAHAPADAFVHAPRNQVLSFLPPAHSREPPPEGRTLPADRPSAGRSRAGPGWSAAVSGHIARSSRRGAKHGPRPDGNHLLPDVLGMS